MRYSEILTEAAVPAISPQQARDDNMFGPMYHGTQSDLRDIIATGFDLDRSVNDASNGYRLEPYRPFDIAAPRHHLGFGIYLTTVKAIAKMYSGGTMKGQREFYLASDRVLEINFGAPTTMMKWWRANGYNMTAEATRNRDYVAWTAATQRLTDTLKSQYDAVHFLGKGIRKLLDGDQVCAFDPSLIRVVDPKLASGLEIGSRVTHSQVIPPRYQNSNRFYVDTIQANDRVSYPPTWKGMFRGDLSDDEMRQVQQMGRYPMHIIPSPDAVGVITGIRRLPDGSDSYAVKWPKGGVQFDYSADELLPKQR